MNNADQDLAYDMAASFIQRLTGNEKTPVTFQTYADSKTGDAAKSNGNLVKVLHGRLHEHFNTLWTMNEHGAGIFVTVNETDLRGRRAENITGIRAIWSDDDTGRIDPASHPLKPQIVTKTSPGHQQVYWLTEGAPLEEHGGVLDRIIEDHHGDKGAKGINRVLRLPGFYHKKDPTNPHLCEIIHMTDDPPYSWDRIKRVFPPIGGSKKTKGQRLSEAAERDKVCQYLQQQGLVLGQKDGGVYLECPFSEEHTTKNQPTDCVYFPANTGGYANGHFKCLHGHCADRTNEEFLKAIGYVEKPAEKAPKYVFRHISEIEAKAIEFAVDGLVPMDGLTNIFGDPGAAKTLFAIDQACCIATGKDFFGRKVKQGPVVYIAGEGQHGIKLRFNAWAIRHQKGINDAPVFLLTSPLALCASEDTPNVIASLKAFAEKHGPPVQIIIDTLARNFGPGNENSPEDMNGFVRSLDLIRQPFGASIVVLHHTGHGNKDRARGSMVFKAALDAEYRLDVDEERTVRCCYGKPPKDFEPPEKMAFKICTVELGIVDKHGDPVTSAILDPTEYEPPAKQNKTPGKNQKIGLEILERLYEEHRQRRINGGYDGNGARVKFEDWKDACVESDIMDRKAFFKIKNSLQQAGLVFFDHGYVELT
jgi:hypothetical protein